MTPNIHTIAHALEQLAPLPLAEGYDNVGLLVGEPHIPCTGVLLSLDCTEAVVDEAIAMGCNMVVSHHPIWFGPRKRLNGEDYVSRTLLKAIRHHIALYAIHTNLDNVQQGVNRMLAQRLGLQHLRILQPHDATLLPQYQAGAGMLGSLPVPTTTHHFLQQVAQALGCSQLRTAGPEGRPVQQVAVCGGSGSFLIGAAIAAGADVLLTADFTYHKYFDHEDKILLIDAGHWETEQFTPELLYSFLTEKFPSFAAYLSKVNTNPVKYHHFATHTHGKYH